LNLIPFDTDLVRVDLKPWIVTPSSIADAESPCMPRAGHSTLFVQVTRAKRCPLMRAEIVDHVVLALMEKQCKQLVSHGDGGASSFGEASDFGDGLKFGHW